MTGSAEVTGSFKVQGASGNVLNIGNDGSFTLGQGASSTNSVPNTSVVIGKNATVTSNDSVVIGDSATTNAGGQNNVIIGHDASVISNTSFGVVVGESAYVFGTNGIALGRSSTAAGDGIAIGRDSNVTGNRGIAIGKGATAGTDQLLIGHSSTYEPIISASLETGHIILSQTSSDGYSQGGLEVHGSGSTVFEVIGSQGTLFSITDNLTQGSLFAVKDINGFPLLDITRNTSSADIVTVGQSNLILDSGSLQTTGSINVTGSVNLSDGTRLNLGNSGDLKIYHDGSNSYIDETGTGALFYRGGTQTFQNAAGTKTMLTLNAASSVDLRFDNSTKLSTTNTGIKVTGEITASGNISSSATSTASFGTYIGDGSQLTGISAGTDFTQSLFVSPSGDNSTAIVGDMSKPFATILGATGSANPGDTIIVYPGKYIENNNLYKDGVNYHFIDGAIVESTNPVEPMWGGGGGAANGIEYFSSPVSITGNGEFINTSNTTRTGTIFYLGAPSGIIEFKKAFRAGIGGTSYVTAANFAQQRTADAHGVLTIKGEIENSGSGGNLGSVVGFLDGNINSELIVRQHKGAGTAVKIWGTSCDLNATMDVYSEGMAVDVAARTSALTVLKGRYETLTSNQGTYYCIDAGYNSRGNTLIDAEVRGSIKIEHGSQYEGSTTIMGYQEVSNSPGGAACVIVDGQNQLSQRIYSGQPAFKVTGGQTTFDGTVRHTGYNSKVFDISAGTFNWKGTCTGNTSYPTTRTDPNVVSGGELIIESQFECFSQTANVNNEYMFNLSGGTLDIRNKLRNNINSLNNGIVNMTGGYLRMNGAELVHATQTGSFAFAIDLNNTAHSGSILNNCFTNLTPFGNTGSFTNEILGGGTLFYSNKLY